MARDDKFKQYQTVGSDLMEAARSQVEEFVRELFRAGQTTSKQAQGQVDDLVELGRRSSDQLISTIRAEVAQQLGQLGLATKADLADLERRLGGSGRSTAKKAGAAKTAARSTGAKKAAATRKAGAARSAATRKTAAKKAAATRKATAAKTTKRA